MTSSPESPESAPLASGADPAAIPPGELASDGSLGLDATAALVSLVTAADGHATDIDAPEQWVEPEAEPPALLELPAFIDLLRRRVGVDFSGYKKSTLTRRIMQRLLSLRCETPAQYLELVQSNALERDALCQDLLINVTEFFRDAEVFTLLSEEVLPDLLRGRDPGDELRLWSAGCATGEEAYSLAMLALEAAGRLGFDGNVKVFATDLQPRALADASRGEYSDAAVARIPQPLLRRYFQNDGGLWRVDSSLRRHVVFARHNLVVDPPFTRIDLALCRNLLIYLLPAAQLQVLGHLHFALKPQGFVLLGSSETMGDYEGRAYSSVDRTRKLFRKRPAVLPRQAGDMPAGSAQAIPAPVLLTEMHAVGSAHEFLEAELQATRERLQEMVLELQSSHERIDLANEELTASNEELQSTNEEMKSVNEDLFQLNQDLEGKNRALETLNRDYDHLLASAEIGTVFLDSGLCVRRFSPAVGPFLALRDTDIGRPIGEITYRQAGRERFVADLQRVAQTAARVEHEVETAPGRWFLERMLPFHGPGGGHEGVVLTWTDISEVKKIEAQASELAAERTRLQSILDALPDGVYIVSPQHEIEYINPVLVDTFGPPAGRKCYDYFHGRSSECPWCKNAEVHEGKSVHWEWTSSQGRTFDLFDMPFRNPDGSVSKFEIFHDITPIRESKARLQEAAKLAEVGYWEWNLVTNAVRWGEQTFRCFGYEPHAVEPTYQRFISHVVSEDREQVDAVLREARDAQTDYLTEFRFHRTDGSLRIGRATGRVSCDDEGRVLRLSGAMQDITALRQSEERFRVVFRASPLAVSIARLRDGVFVEVNDKFERYFGWTREMLLGHSSVAVGLWPDEATRQAWITVLMQKGTVLDFETSWRNQAGDVRQVSLSSELIDIDDVPHIITFIQDITERKESEARIEYLAHHDALTNLPNRVLFRDRFALATAWAERCHGRVALLFIDLDQFKTINDTLGHPVGDALLQQVAQRLREAVRDTDTISRQGGDEFLIALSDLGELDAIERVAGKLVDAVAAPFSIDGVELATTLSMGVAVWPDDGKDFDLLLQRADTAMYQAKNAGRNTYRFYTAKMNDEALDRLQLRSALRRGLEQGEFLLHYQPQIDLVSRQVIGVEALLRWNRNGEELVPPGRFIPAAEESGLIVPIGEWVLREACRQAAAWQQAGWPEFVMAVNLSAVQFRRGDLENTVTSALVDSGLDPTFLELELTESLLLDDAEGVLETVRRFKALGLRLSIDDFGTGYSSLAYLKRFAVDKIKIDQSFVRDITTDPDDAAIVRAVISMARSLKLKVIAEGVETEAMARFLQLYHCDEAQGYYYARPMPAPALAVWLEHWNSLVRH